MIIEANCKINIGLDVLRRRRDGYHEIETVMYPVRRLCDRVSVEKNGLDRSRLTVKGLAVDCADEDNLCLKAAAIMSEEYGTGGVDIVLEKRIPFGAGLGGGSSDAVAVINAVDSLFGLKMTLKQKSAVAARLGSDTVFFVRNTPQLCKGRGDIVKPLDLSLAGMALVIAKPDEGVSTREAYSGITPATPYLPLSEAIMRPATQWRGSVKNDFEIPIFNTHPRIAALKSAMYARGALYASMSGSGSAVFGLFDSMVDFAAPFEGVFVHSEIL